MRFSPLTGIPWFPTCASSNGCSPWRGRFQSPDGDSVVSHKPFMRPTSVGYTEFQSPDGDSVVSHKVFEALPDWVRMIKFQSPDGDSVVSHLHAARMTIQVIRIGFSPLTGIPWFPTCLLCPAGLAADQVSVP